MDLDSGDMRGGLVYLRKVVRISLDIIALDHWTIARETSVDVRAVQRYAVQCILQCFLLYITLRILHYIPKYSVLLCNGFSFKITTMCMNGREQGQRDRQRNRQRKTNLASTLRTLSLSYGLTARRTLTLTK